MWAGYAEEGLEHLKKQYELQQGFASSYQEVVNEVSEALQATSAANRHVSSLCLALHTVELL